mmetsp:Transcript_15434/g.23290  ORF Transcript_15434/g.23290 Transcript_15434/m.23290 type:complete len:740 (-) Transcript_15434:175-2394(-)
MDDIKDIIGTIVRGCAQGGVVVSEVLAAFVARTIVESSTDSFALDRALTSEAKDEVIIQSIEKLLEKDSPQLETMKMQVDFDCSFLEEDAEFQKTIRLHKKVVSTARANIAELEMQDANDFEALTTLYRKIFRFLLEFVPTEKSIQDRAIEREVAAALESVFPRIGLKAFVQLSYEEKNAQLMELARIVFGIRLFNRHQDRGGAGIDNIDSKCPELAGSIDREIRKEAESVSNLCSKYQEIIVKTHLQRRRLEMKAREKINGRINDCKDEDIKGDDSVDDVEMEDEEVGDWLLERWSHELANRRQYLAFLRSLQEEVGASVAKITDLIDTIQDELINLSGLVGGRASVAKEQVYPRFDALASTWLTLWEEYNLLRARNNTYMKLKLYRSSYVCALTERMYSTLGRIMDLKGDVVSLAAAKSGAYDDEKATMTPLDKKHSIEDKSGNKGGMSKVDDEDNDGDGGPDDMTAEAKTDSANNESSIPRVYNDRDIVLETMSAKGAALLSVHDTPDFMQLPLELQGFCPWTMVHANGLLVPGKPALGVIRYENLYYVCEHKVAIKAFMDDPAYHIKKIKETAQKSPEYIHLLRLQNYFPSASIARLVERPDFDAQSGSKPTTKDASTGTPTHFIEKRIDPHYHWNEWVLRQRVLKVVNLKNCRTVGQQTDQSHFKRDSETQVYLPRAKETQTKRDRGTNPATKSVYITGLRGKLSEDAKAVSRYISPDVSNKERVRAVTLTLDP